MDEAETYNDNQAEITYNDNTHDNWMQQNTVYYDEHNMIDDKDNTEA